MKDIVDSCVDRNSHTEAFCIKGILDHFPKFTGKHLRQSLFFDKVAGVFFTEHLWWLLLNRFNCF